MRLQSKAGPISSLKATIITDGGLSLEMASPIEKQDYCDLLLSYSNSEIMTSLPELQLFFIQGGQQKTQPITLPIFLNKFSVPYQMETKSYMQAYKKFSQNEKYFKLDEFFILGELRSQSLNDFLKKAKTILQSFMQMSVQVYPEIEAIQVVYGTGQILRNSQEHQAIPYIIEIEGFEESPEKIRVSIRSAYSPFIVHGLYQILVVYLQMAI